VTLTGFLYMVAFAVPCFVQGSGPVEIPPRLSGQTICPLEWRLRRGGRPGQKQMVLDLCGPSLVGHTGSACLLCFFGGGLWPGGGVCGGIWESFRLSVDRGTPVATATSLIDIPCAMRARAGRRSTFRSGRPQCLPLDCAKAIPAWTRSMIKDLSNSATAQET